AKRLRTPHGVQSADERSFGGIEDLLRLRSPGPWFGRRWPGNLSIANEVLASRRRRAQCRMARKRGQKRARDNPFDGPIHVGPPSLVHASIAMRLFFQHGGCKPLLNLSPLRPTDGRHGVNFRWARASMRWRHLAWSSRMTVMAELAVATAIVSSDIHASQPARSPDLEPSPMVARVGIASTARARFAVPFSKSHT